MQVSWLHSYLRHRNKSKASGSQLSLNPNMELARNILTAVLGAALVKVAQEFRATGPLQISQVRRELDACFERGLVDGIALITEQLIHRSQRVTAFTQQLTALAT